MLPSCRMVYTFSWGVFIFGALLCDLNGKYVIKSLILPLFTENALSRVEENKVHEKGSSLNRT